MPPEQATARQLLDRGRELAEVAERLDAAREGSGSALLIEGPGGIELTPTMKLKRSMVMRDYSVTVDALYR